MNYGTIAKPTKHHRHSPLEDSDGVAINDEFAILLGDLSLVTTVGGVILKHVGLGSRMKMKWSFGTITR